MGVDSKGLRCTRPFEGCKVCRLKVGTKQQPGSPKKKQAAGVAAGRREGGEDGRELSKDRVARELMLVKDNLLVIRMIVAGLTQWGTSWPRERLCGRGVIRKNCGNPRKSQGTRKVESLRLKVKTPEEPRRENQNG